MAPSGDAGLTAEILQTAIIEGNVSRDRQATLIRHGFQDLGEATLRQRGLGRRIRYSELPQIPLQVGNGRIALVQAEDVYALLGANLKSWKYGDRGEFRCVPESLNTPNVVVIGNRKHINAKLTGFFYDRFDVRRLVCIRIFLSTVGIGVVMGLFM